MKKNIKFSFNVAFLTIIFLFGLKSNSFAYIDPGTGSYIIQLILAFLASCYIFFTNPVKFVKEKIKNFREKKKIDRKDSNRSN